MVVTYQHLHTLTLSDDTFETLRALVLVGAQDMDESPEIDEVLAAFGIDKAMMLATAPKHQAAINAYLKLNGGL